MSESSDVESETDAESGSGFRVAEEGFLIEEGSYDFDEESDDVVFVEEAVPKKTTAKTAAMPPPEQFVNEVDEEYKCGICFNVLDQPHSCQDGHTFCKGCITRWVENKQECPTCRAKLKIKSLTRVRVIQNVLEKMPVFCDHRNGPAFGGERVEEEEEEEQEGKRGGEGEEDEEEDEEEDDDDEEEMVLVRRCGQEEEDEEEDEEAIHRDKRRKKGGDASSLDAVEGCAWTGQLCALQTHMSCCPFGEAQCSFGGCNKVFQRRFMGDHQAGCEHRLVACPNCAEQVPHNKLGAHDKQCKKKVVPCRKQCGAAVCREGMKAHVADDCPNAKAKCPFRKHGCKAKILRKDFAEHQAAAAHKHAELMASKLEDQEKRLDTLEGVPAPQEVSFCWTIPAFTSKGTGAAVESKRISVVTCDRGTYKLFIKVKLTDMHLELYLKHDRTGSCIMPLMIGGSSFSIGSKDVCTPFRCALNKDSRISAAGEGLGWHQRWRLRSRTKASVVDRCDDDGNLTITGTIRIHRGEAVEI